MPIISFTSQVLSAYGQSPSNLSWSISGGSGGFNTVELLTVGTGPINNASLSAKQVRGIAFNALTSPASGAAGAFATLSAATGTTLRVNSAYNGSTFAVIYTDNSSTLFTCVTGTGTTAQTLTANGFDSVTPEVRRLFVLGYR
jgi:hypothetical protein